MTILIVVSILDHDLVGVAGWSKHYHENWATVYYKVPYIQGFYVYTSGQPMDYGSYSTLAKSPSCSSSKTKICSDAVPGVRRQGVV